MILFLKKIDVCLDLYSFFAQLYYITTYKIADGKKSVSNSGVHCIKILAQKPNTKSDICSSHQIIHNNATKDFLVHHQLVQCNSTNDRFYFSLLQPLALKGHLAFAEMWERISNSPEEAVFPTMETGLQMIQDNQDVLFARGLCSTTQCGPKSNIR